MDNKTAMQELLEWVMEFEDKPVKPTLTNIKEKIWQLLPKERQQIEEAYKQGDEDGFHSTESVSDYEIEGRSDYLASNYFNQTYQ